MFPCLHPLHVHQACGLHQCWPWGALLPTSTINGIQKVLEKHNDDFEMTHSGYPILATSFIGWSSIMGRRASWFRIPPRWVSIVLGTLISLSEKYSNCSSTCLVRWLSITHSYGKTSALGAQVYSSGTVLVSLRSGFTAEPFTRVEQFRPWNLWSKQLIQGCWGHASCAPSSAPSTLRNFKPSYFPEWIWRMDNNGLYRNHSGTTAGAKWLSNCW